MTATPDRQPPPIPARWSEPPDRQRRHLAVANEDRQDRQPPTHRIVATDRQDDTATDDRQGWMGEWAAGLRFVHDSPGSLLDQVDYARDGAYSIQVDGWWRSANIWFARLIAIPGLAICYLMAWAFFTRLSRTLISLVVAPLLFMLLNGFPVTAWLVPDGLDFTTRLAPAAPAVG